jgi:glycosyltransferase involved in cell wall biosynthesis
MAHTVGEILHARFDYDLVAVDVGISAPVDTFPYRVVPPTIPMEALFTEPTEDDIIVINPSFSSLGLGLRTPARTLCYVQGFNTYPLLDRFLGDYVSVGPFVAGHLKTHYDLATPVIPAFVNLPVERLTAWQDRPAATVLVSAKATTDLNRLVADRVLDRLAADFPDLAFEPLVTGHVTQPEIHARLAGHRYFLTLSITEGFGLLPLEAMAHGLFVFGFDGFGGRTYMRPGENCMTVAYPDLDGIIAAARLIRDDAARVEAMAAAARQTGAGFGLAAFEARWTEHLSRLLGRSPGPART